MSDVQLITAAVVIALGLAAYVTGYFVGQLSCWRDVTLLRRYRVAAEEAAKWLGSDPACRLTAEWIAADAEQQGSFREPISTLRDRIRQLRKLNPEATP